MLPFFLLRQCGTGSVAAPSPLAGEGFSASNHKEWVRGFGRDPSPDSDCCTSCEALSRKGRGLGRALVQSLSFSRRDRARVLQMAYGERRIGPKPPFAIRYSPFRYSQLLLQSKIASRLTPAVGPASARSLLHKHVARIERSEIRDRRFKLLNRPRVSLRSTRATMLRVVQYRMSRAKSGIGVSSFTIVPGFRCAHPGYKLQITTNKEGGRTPAGAFGPSSAPYGRGSR
jgi:hypothetical protein